ncbi:MAG: hypothetical protein ACMUHY_05895 [Thermoplasmatota archaeon]
MGGIPLENEGRYIVLFALIAIVVGSGILVLHLLTQSDDRLGAIHSYEFRSEIDSANNTLTMTEPNRTVNWNDYLVVVNGTFVMRRSRIAVPGISTSFHDPDWDPLFGCCYDVEVVERGPGRKVWNSTVKAGS